MLDVASNRVKPIEECLMLRRIEAKVQMLKGLCSGHGASTGTVGVFD